MDSCEIFDSNSPTLSFSQSLKPSFPHVVFHLVLLSCFSCNKPDQFGFLFVCFFLPPLLSFSTPTPQTHSSAGNKITWNGKRVTSQAFIYSVTNHRGRIWPSFPAAMGRAGRNLLSFLQLWYLTHHSKAGWGGEGESEACSRGWRCLSHTGRFMQLHPISPEINRALHMQMQLQKSICHVFKGFASQPLHYTRS